MGADKIGHAVDTGAEFLVAADNSCLMHLGGEARRMQAPVRTIHLAEILASTEAAPEYARAAR
jgi:L-lactate dehydrogenase complex protein LldE